MENHLKSIHFEDGSFVENPVNKFLINFETKIDQRDWQKGKLGKPVD